MKKHSALSAIAVMSALGSMGISGVPITEQPFKSPRIPEPTPRKNTTREQQRRMRQQAKKQTK